MSDQPTIDDILNAFETRTVERFGEPILGKSEEELEPMTFYEAKAKLEKLIAAEILNELRNAVRVGNNVDKTAYRVYIEKRYEVLEAKVRGDA